ncbi:unnamed protein product [Coccothraustes coccothraustes]
MKNLCYSQLQLAEGHDLISPLCEDMNSLRGEISETSSSSSVWIGPDGVRYSNHAFNQGELYAVLPVEGGKQGITSLFKCGTHEEMHVPLHCFGILFHPWLSNSRFWACQWPGCSYTSLQSWCRGALYVRMMGSILVSLTGVQTSEYGVWIDTGLCCHWSCLIFQRCFKTNHLPHCDNGKLNLELFSARDVMEPGVRALHLKENIASLAWLLANTSHGRFPEVCRPKPERAEVFQGTIKSLRLCILLEKKQISELETNDESFTPPLLSYEKITVEKLPSLSRPTMLLNRYSTDPWYQQLFINLVRLKPTLKTNISSMNNMFVIFSHLFMMANLQNQVFGMISRKDLMPFILEERLRLQLAAQSPAASEQPLDSRPCMPS